MKINEAIILAGGFGKRLSNVISEIPKPMAPIGSTPFLEIIINQLLKNKIEKIVLCTGYKSNIIEDYFNTSKFRERITFSVEQTPLGTGGAVKNALDLVKDNTVLIANGDTFLDINIQNMFNFHLKNKSNLTLSLKHIKSGNRYGEVVINSNNRIISFKEKKELNDGFINTGFSIMDKKILNKMPQIFSMEQDFLAKSCDIYKFYGYVSDGYFIDIGIPEDYEKAQKELNTYR